ncbi:hypothetical protein ASG80_00825 [Agromyces sp. Soil535]|nr:hypothetical protein ASG80_00825 [Agromyces sp. Soil535]
MTQALPSLTDLTGKSAAITGAGTGLGRGSQWVSARPSEEGSRLKPRMWELARRPSASMRSSDFRTSVEAGHEMPTSFSE